MVQPGPPDLSKWPSKQAQVEQANEDSHCWPSSGCFIEQYLHTAAAILGKKKTIFESIEAAKLEKGESKRAL